MTGSVTHFEADPRVRVLLAGAPDPEAQCVIYWMQRSQRGRDNPALNLAIELGNTLRRPVLAVFGLTADYPGAQRRHYRFLLDAMPEIRDDLKARNVEFVLRIGSPPDVVLTIARECRPAVVVGDENPIRVGQTWRDRVARELTVPFFCVDADVVVPTSLFPKQEYAARTSRPKIQRVWNEYLKPIPDPVAEVRWPRTRLPKGEAIDPEALLKSLKIGGVGEVKNYKGGTAEALRRLDRFVKDRLPRYASDRNEPTPYNTSELSAHLHFGQISPLTIALAVQASDASPENIDAYLEELIVRRELAINFVARNPNYDRLAGCPDWALKTLARHASDRRPHLYKAQQLEAAETQDPIWNASQKEMLLTGRMHNYLRMYWVKKILEWTPDAETAFQIAIDLNDRYEMDGRDPNGYAGVAWAIGGKHDRPWPERPIFGTVRFMSYDGIRKKIDSAAYIRRVEQRERESG
ncbi:deoxyribodipyrimidine photo-lyase [soil metagenome]